MKFGKHILANQVPGWSAFYLDYKGLKKIVSSLTKRRLASNASLSPSIVQESIAAARPASVLRSPAASSPLAQPTLWESSAAASLAQPPLPAMLTSAHDGDRGPVFQEHKTAFFVKLERELEKINAFYLQKEAELRLRLENLLRKRQAAAERLVVNGTEDGALDYVEWRAVEEGFQLLERDLGKLQQFIEVNATGFRKILKKWDKRSKSTTKELYLSRQVEVMPCFNRQLISEMTDTVASCLLDVSTVPDSSSGGGGTAYDNMDRMTAFNDLEDSFGRAIKARDEGAIRELLVRAGNLAAQPGGQMHVTRIVWRSIIVAPVPLADLMLASNDVPFDFGFVDDINGRTCLHEAAIAGELRLVQICLGRGVQVDRADAYARTALHYAAMRGHAAICRALLEYNGPRGVIDPSALDSDNYSPLIYACIQGSSDCVAALLTDKRVSLEPPPTASDLRPLALAAKYGHVDIVSLLIGRGARDVPNSNGEYAIHLAARNGHAALCKLLVQHDTCDRADKYNEWTPLFHAAEQGHLECVQVLLQAGSNPTALDENARTAMYYAAWNGHLACVAALLAGARTARPRAPSAHVSPSGVGVSPGQDGSEADGDAIPSLSLPPPIMPLRSYGHAHLSKAHLVVVALAHPFTGNVSEPVRLRPRVFAQTDRFSQNTPSLRLVVSTRPDSYAAPFEVSLPLGSEKGVLAFQVPALDQLSLEFSLYPSFGSKTLGRAVALPCMFANIGEMTPVVLPMLDRRLHVIGEISFDIFTISPFAGPALSVGNNSGTYWRSSTLQSSAPAPPPPPRTVGSAHTSPSNRSTAGSDYQRGVTASSLGGDFLHVVVQLTQDGVPVLCRQQALPDSNYTLGVGDVTLAQFQALSARLGRNVLKQGQAATAADWKDALKDSLIPLSTLGEALPPSIGLCLELACPSARDRGRRRSTTDTNQFVDAVLHAVYTVSSRNPDSARRKFALFSFSPDLCAALNWKQPNYPVFFASDCGAQHSQREIHSFYQGTQDRRCTSLGAAVDFAKDNNLLGILVPASLLADVPSLSSGVKSNGLMLASFGSSEIPGAPDVVDASLAGGILTVREHKLSVLI